MPPIVYDATAPAAHVRNHGPGKVSHAYPENSRVALCGHVRAEHARQGHAPKCALCIEQTGKRHWIGR